jgi:acyl-CoA synthetase (AMP-forming)/AMP-acid ligase II
MCRGHILCVLRVSIWLRKDIWTEFQSRFQIKDIVEFYGATELPVGFINIYNQAGAVGKINPLLQSNMSIYKSFYKKCSYVYS